MPLSIRNPYPPIEVLAPQQLDQLHTASLHILENIGLDFLDDEALDLWQQAGMRVDRARQHVWLDGGLVMELVAHAPSTFTWRARNPLRHVQIGGDAIVFAPCGGMVFCSDVEGGRRAGTLAAMQNFYKLGQMCNLLHFACWEQVAPLDVPLNTRHLHRLLADFLLTDKPVMEAAHGRIITSDAVEMARIAFGGVLPESGPVMGDVINANSPLRYDQRMLGGLITLARAGQATIITPFILAGAMSPITMASALAQQNAEALAGIALTQLVRAGAPVVYGGFTTNTHMKSGAPAFGTPEGAWAGIVGAQLARRYGVPYRGNGGLTTANLVDAQAASESLWHLWSSVLSHANLIMHSCGWLEGGLTSSFEKFVLDAHSLAEVARFLGTEVKEVWEFGEWGVERREWEIARFGVEGASQLVKKLLRDYSQPAISETVHQELLAFVTRREGELRGINLYEMGGD